MKPRFSIRDLIFITIIVALAVGWWIDRRDKQDNAETFAIKLQRLVQKQEGTMGVLVLYRNALIEAGVEVPAIHGGTEFPQEPDIRDFQQRLHYR